MTSRIKACAVTLMAVLGLLLGGAGLANAAPAGSAQPAAAAAAKPVVKDCNVTGGATRGCSYFNPNNNRFRVCDERVDGGYTIGRVSVNGDPRSTITITASDGAGCYPFDDVYVPARPGDRVCVRTGWEGHGYTEPECVRV